MIEYTCQKGHLINVKFNRFCILDLSIYSFINKEEISLEEIIENKFQLEITDKSKYCQFCKEEILINEKEYIYNLPKIIILYFSRKFDDIYYNNKVKFNKDLDFYKYLKNSKNNDSIYHLFGIIQNNKGHFNSITINHIDNNWYLFDNEDQPLLVNIDLDKFNPIALFYSK